MRPENMANLIFPAQCRYRSDNDDVSFGRCVCQSERIGNDFWGTFAQSILGCQIGLFESEALRVTALFLY